MTVKNRLTNIILLAIMIAIAISFGGTPVSYARDGNDYYHSDSSSVFSPGYINVAKHEADMVMRQQTQVNKSLFSNLLDFVQDTVGAVIKPHKSDEEIAKPVLQQKTSGSNKPKTMSVGPTMGNVKIGNGDEGSQKRDASGRLLGESFNGVFYWYAGFDNVGSSLNDALSLAKTGGNLIVKAGTYNFSMFVYNTAGGGVSMYGGYNEDGVRDIRNTSTTLNIIDHVTSSGLHAANPVEIDGFRFTGNGSIPGLYFGLTIDRCPSLTLSNNVFDTQLNISNSSVTLKNNTFNVQNGVGIQGAQGFVYTTPSHIISINNNYNSNIAIRDVSGISTFKSTNDYFMGSVGGTGGELAITVERSSSNPNSLYATSSDSPLTNYQPYTSGLSLKINNDDSLLFYQKNLSDNAVKDGYNGNDGGAILKYMLVAKNSSQTDPALAIKLLQDSLSSSALALPQGRLGVENMDIAAKLASIIKSPTEDQKAILDVIKALLADVSKVNKEEAVDGSANPQFKKAEDDLLNAVANILLAQAVPDLMNRGDVSSVKTLFSDLDISKKKILFEYETSIKRYYENVAKDLVKNMAALQAGNILTPKITKDELDKMPPSELDKILAKIKKEENRTFEEEYILQQETKYRKAYIEPGRKRFEEDMKNMMQVFTGKISDMLKGGAKK